MDNDHWDFLTFWVYYWTCGPGVLFLAAVLTGVLSECFEGRLKRRLDLLGCIIAVSSVVYLCILVPEITLGLVGIVVFGFLFFGFFAMMVNFPSSYGD